MIYLPFSTAFLLWGEGLSLSSGREMGYTMLVFIITLIDSSCKTYYIFILLIICFFSTFTQVTFYIQDSDDVYGLFRFDQEKEQSVQSQPEGRFLSLHFVREGGTFGDVSMTLTALYIPAGPVDPARARDQVLNVSRNVNVAFARERMVHVILPIRNDAFLQNGAHFLIQVTWLKAKCSANLESHCNVCPFNANNTK